MNLLTILPAQYAKFIAALVTVLVTYLEAYGATWHLVPAVLAIAGALGVAGVPNTPKPAPVSAAPVVAPAPVYLVADPTVKALP